MTFKCGSNPLLALDSENWHLVVMLGALSAELLAPIERHVTVAMTDGEVERLLDRAGKNRTIDPFGALRHDLLRIMVATRGKRCLHLNEAQDLLATLEHESARRLRHAGLKHEGVDEEPQIDTASSLHTRLEWTNQLRDPATAKKLILQVFGDQRSRDRLQGPPAAGRWSVDQDVKHANPKESRKSRRRLLGSW